MDRKLKQACPVVHPGLAGRTQFILFEICTNEATLIGKHYEMRPLAARKLLT
jgi:hypothetical protein